MITELCTCCGLGGRGFNEQRPEVWTGCQCLGIRRCESCSNCYQHCVCVTAEARFEALDREEEAVRALMAQARRLAEALGIDEMYGALNEDTVWQIEQRLRVRYLTFKRFRRRFDHLLDIHMNRQSVEWRAQAELITVESDRPS
jgi:hypothetical protein